MSRTRVLSCTCVLILCNDFFDFFQFKPVTSILWSWCNAARIGNGSHCLQVQTCWMTHLRDFRGFLQLLLVRCNGKACAINIVYLQKRSYYHNNVYFHRKRIVITLLILSLFNEYYTAVLTQTCHIRSTPKKRYESLVKWRQVVKLDCDEY